MAKTKSVQKTDRVIAPVTRTPVKLMDLPSEFHAHVVWQWDNNSVSCALALWNATEIPPREGTAMDYLREGQKHNSHVVELYNVYHREVSRDRFWREVGTASGKQSDFDQARANIDWQWYNNLRSLDFACREWKNANGDLFRKLRALYSLLIGQQHNPGVMSLYRACFRDDADRLFAIIQEYFHT